MAFDTFVPIEDFNYYVAPEEAPAKKDSSAKQTAILSSLFDSIVNTFTKAFSSFFSPTINAIQKFYYVHLSDRVTPIILFDELGQPDEPVQ